MSSEFSNVTQAKQSCSAGGAGFRAVGRGIGDRPKSIGGARREKCQKSRFDPTRRNKVIRCAMDIDWIGKDYSLQPHKKFQRGTVWVSDDEVRLPLRVEVKVFIGHVFAELAEVKAAL